MTQCWSAFGRAHGQHPPALASWEFAFRSPSLSQLHQPWLGFSLVPWTLPTPTIDTDDLAGFLLLRDGVTLQCFRRPAKVGAGRRHVVAPGRNVVADASGVLPLTNM